MIVRAKDEGEFIAVSVIDEARYTAWKRANGIADDALAIPYGSRPDGTFNCAVGTTEDVEQLAAFFPGAQVEWS